MTLLLWVTVPACASLESAIALVAFAWDRSADPAEIGRNEITNWPVSPPLCSKVPAVAWSGAAAARSIRKTNMIAPPSPILPKHLAARTAD
jgi:hypothetical protein